MGVLKLRNISGAIKLISPFLNCMALLDSLITGTADFLIHRLVEISFSIAHTFTEIVAGPIAGPTAVTDYETSPDSDAPEFLSREEFITASLLRFRASMLLAGSQLRPRLQILRYRSRVFLHGSTLSLPVLVTLAGVSRSWFHAISNFARDQLFLRFEDTESASERWELPDRVLQSTPTEYMARFTGRVVQNLGRGRISPPNVVVDLQPLRLLNLSLYSFVVLAFQLRSSASLV